MFCGKFYLARDTNVKPLICCFEVCKTWNKQMKNLFYLQLSQPTEVITVGLSPLDVKKVKGKLIICALENIICMFSNSLVALLCERKRDVFTEQ